MRLYEICRFLSSSKVRATVQFATELKRYGATSPSRGAISAVRTLVGYIIGPRCTPPSLRPRLTTVAGRQLVGRLNQKLEYGSIFLRTGWTASVQGSHCSELVQRSAPSPRRRSVVEASETDRDGSHRLAGPSITQDVDQGPSYRGIEMMGEILISGNLSFISNQNCLISWTQAQNEKTEYTEMNVIPPPLGGYFDKAKLEDALARVRRHQNVAFDEEREAWQDHLNVRTRVPASRDEVLIA